MRTSALRRLLGLALLALLLFANPAAASVYWHGHLGLSLQQDDRWAGGLHAGRSFFWFTGALSLDASFFAPGTLTLGGSADYRGYRASSGVGSDGFNYSLRLSALGRTPLRLSAMASRDTVEFTSDSNNARTGTSQADSMSAVAALFLEDAPFLSTTFRTTRVTNKAIVAPPVRYDTNGLIIDIGQGIDGADYRLTYDSNWSNGDYAESNFKSHHVAFETNATIAAGTSAKLRATYFLRLPTLSSSLNPRIDNQLVSAWLQWGGSTEAYGGGGYSYSSSLFEVPGEPIRESVAHSLNAYGTRQLNSELALDLSAGATTSQTSADQVEQRATGEQVGAGLRWARQGSSYNTNASLFGGLGAFQPGSGDDSLAWSLGASGGVTRPISSWQLGASLIASHDSSTGALAGSRTRVLGIATALGEPLGWSLNSLLNLGYAFSDSPTFGERRTINARINAQARRSGYTFEVNAGLTDDLSEVLAPVSLPPSGVVPGDFNTQSRYAILTATVPTVQALYLSFSARYLSFTSPGHGTQWETGATISASYYLGAFQFSLYDQVTKGGGDLSSTGTQNLLFFSVTRSFGR